MTVQNQDAASSLQIRDIDLSATEASFEARSWHGAVHGRVPVRSGRITVDAAGQPVAVSAELDLSGLDTGNARRDRDLCGQRFFDAAAHPMIRFQADDVAPVADGWQLRGVLSAGRTECPLVVHVQRGGRSDDGFTGTASVTRRELGVKAPGFLIRNQITLRISTRLLP